MNKLNIKLMSFILALAMCASMNLSVFAANILGVTFDAVASSATLPFSNESQNVTVTVTANQAISMDGFGAEILCPDGWGVMSVTSEDFSYTEGDLFLANKKIAFTSQTLNNITNIDQLAVITYNVPAGAAAGTYELGLKEMELTADGAKIWESAGIGTTKVQIVSSESSGYTAGISTDDATLRVGDTLVVNVTVNGTTYENFASSELILSYSDEKLSFDATSIAEGATLVADNGTLKLEDFGEAKNFGTVYTLKFNAIAAGNAEVNLISAKFSTQAHSEANDLVDATLTSDSVSATIVQTYTVTLPDGFVGATTVNAGENYTFEVVDKTNYTYAVTATMAGQPVAVTDNKDGTYSISNVYGVLVISSSATPNSYQVTFAGTGADDVVDQRNTATYKEPYIFVIPEDTTEHTYTLTNITYANGETVPYTIAEKTVTILGTDIIGDFTITIAKNIVLPTVASVTITGAVSDVNYSSTATPGTDYTFTVKMDDHYDYEVTASVNGTAITLVSGENGVYTIKADAFEAGDSIAIYVTKTIKTSNVSPSKYVTVDESQIWLIKVDTEKMDGAVYTYKEHNMFWSAKYEAYCFLVISNEEPVVTAADLAIVTGTETEVDYGMDVNMTGEVDANDAQLTYNIYNVHYSDFTRVSIEKFLRADVNGDAEVNVQDAQAIIGKILGLTN